MKISMASLLIALLVVILFIFFMKNCHMKCSYSENYGQDASVRVQSGWIAGPSGIYGYDPIDQFAKQIEEMKEFERIKRSGLYMMTDYPDLEDSPTKDIGPMENYTNGKQCRSRADCWEDEKCLAGVCRKINRENYQSSNKEECKSCMTTEDFENTD